MGWYEAIKDLIGVADRLRDADLKGKLADVQMEGAKLAEENSRLRDSLRECREQARVRQDLVYKDNVYWNRSDQSGPFCPKCFDSTGTSARMSVEHDDHCWRCHVCGHAVIKPMHQRQRVADDFSAGDD
jgi:hypothetical protein